MNNNSSLEISIIFPMYNESGNVEPLLTRTIKLLEKIYLNSYEIICVDDASTDNTFETLSQLSNKFKQIKILSLQEHLGHALAIKKGFDATGNSKYTILMNADLQYNPEEIQNFIDKIVSEPELHIVNGWRVHKIDSTLKNIASKIYNFLSRKAFKTGLHDHACNFTLYRTQEIKKLDLKVNDQRFIIAIVKRLYDFTQKEIEEIPIKHLPRYYGESKYPVWRKLIFGIFQFVQRWREIKKILPK